MSDITRILDAIQNGESKASEELLPLVYDELRRLAAAKMAREAPGQTLQPTALVHEAWLRLSADGQPNWQNRAHFLGAAAEAMRRILVENARRKLRLKRGSGVEHVEFDSLAIEAPAEDEKVLQVHESLDALVAEDPQKAQIVKLRFFSGLNYDEIAGLLDVNEKTVRRHWELAKVRLVQIMDGLGSSPQTPQSPKQS
ncbi:MAG: RNA polymerase subunit sigma [Verrucomicrobia bacterium]|nr:MAG: RNA polymerase subunit sigma [Verrucomicrobiota bacterium]